jgi:hypothetical protein
MKRYLSISIVVGLFLLISSTQAQNALLWRDLRGIPMPLRNLANRVTALEARVSAIETQQANILTRLDALEQGGMSLQTATMGVGELFVANTTLGLAKLRRQELQNMVARSTAGDTVYDRHGEEFVWTTEFEDYWTSQIGVFNTNIARTEALLTPFVDRLSTLTPANIDLLNAKMGAIIGVLVSRIDELIVP